MTNLSVMNAIMFWPMAFAQSASIVELAWAPVMMFRRTELFLYGPPAPAVGCACLSCRDVVSIWSCYSLVMCLTPDSS